MFQKIYSRCEDTKIFVAETKKKIQTVEFFFFSNKKPLGKKLQNKEI